MFTVSVTARYAAALALILIAALSLTLLDTRHRFVAVPLILAQVLGGLLLPLMYVVPSPDEDMEDIGIFILLTLAFGPIVSLIAYGVVGWMRQTANPALIGCMIVAALTRVTVQLGLHHFSFTETIPFAYDARLGMNLVKKLLIDWSGLVAMAGWLSASIFKRFDEE